MGGGAAAWDPREGTWVNRACDTPEDTSPGPLPASSPWTLQTSPTSQAGAGIKWGVKAPESWLPSCRESWGPSLLPSHPHPPTPAVRGQSFLAQQLGRKEPPSRLVAWETQGVQD